MLRLDDFAAVRINWDDKAANIADLVAELNLGLQSVVFIDDNPHERARVAEALPELLVPDWPEDPASYASALRALTCFDSPGRSVEDVDAHPAVRDRAPRAPSCWRRSAPSTTGSGTSRSWCAPSRCSPATCRGPPSCSNKTNQMNLTTRRLTERRARCVGRRRATRRRGA